jgi:hypothetical protein
MAALLLRGQGARARAHPYCMECGLVKSPSSEMPHLIGYYMNDLSELSKSHTKSLRYRCALLPRRSRDRGSMILTVWIGCSRKRFLWK